MRNKDDANEDGEDQVMARDDNHDDNSDDNKDHNDKDNDDLDYKN